MPSLLEILKDPNYTGANFATKQAIFDKYSAQDPNFVDANEPTKQAIRQRFGLQPAGTFDIPSSAPITAPSPKAESEGFFPSLVSGVQEAATTLVPAAKLMVSPESQTAAAELSAAKEQAQGNLKQYSFSNVVDKAKEGNYGEALSDLGSFVKQTAGQSIGFQAPAGAAGLAVGAFTGPVGGAIAYGGVLLGEYIASNLARQVEENKGKPVERLNATAAAAGSVALDMFQFTKVFPGLGKLVGLEGKKAAEEAADELRKFAQNPISYKAAVAKGTAKGIAFEVPQEVTQQALERWQAGLSIDPFRDPNAAKEYMEAAAGALFLGGPMGAGSKVNQVRRMKAQLEAAPQAVDDGIAQQVEAEAAASRGETPAAEQPIEQTAAPIEEPIVGQTTAPEAAAAAVTPDQVVQPTVQAPTAETVAGEAVPADTEGVTGEVSTPSKIAFAEPSTPDAMYMPEAKMRDKDAEFSATGNGQSVAFDTPRPSNGTLLVNNIYAKQNSINFGTTSSNYGPVKVSIDPKYIEIDSTRKFVRFSKDERTQENAVRTAIGDAAVDAFLAGGPNVAERTATAFVGQDFGPQFQELAKAFSEHYSGAATPAAEPARPEFELTPSPATTPTTEEVVPEEVIPTVPEGQGAFDFEKEVPSASEPEPETDIADTGYRAAPTGTLMPVSPQPAEGGAAPVTKRGGVGRAGQPAVGVDERESGQPAALTENDILSPAEVRKEARRILTEAGMSPAEQSSILKDYTIEGELDLDALRAGFPPAVVKSPSSAYAVSGKKAQKAPRAKKSKAASDALKQTEGSTSTKADPAFDGFRTVQAALRHIIKTGNPFESVLAARLLPNALGIRFVVVNPGEKVTAPEGFDSARGMYVETPATGVRTIYIHSSKFDGGVQGANARTVLHEALHAATAFKLKVGSFRVDPQSNVAEITDDLTELMQRVAAAYKENGKDLGIPNDAFSDVREFVTYGMTDPRLQEFMLGVSGRKQSLYSRFTSLIRTLFGMSAKHQSAFADLIDATDNLISTRLTPTETRVGKKLGPMTVEVSDVLAQSADKVEEAADKLRKEPKDAGKMMSYFSELWAARSNKSAFVDLVKMGLNSVPKKFQSTYLGALTLDQIKQEAKNNLDPQFSDKVDSIVDNIRTMYADRSRTLSEAGDIAKPWAALVRKNPTVSNMLARVMHLSTINGIDPSTEEGYKASSTLAKMWDSLGEDGKDSAKDIYRRARDFYAGQYETYKLLQEKMIDSSGLDPETKKQVVGIINREYGKKDMVQPYFPLMREGKFWFKVGSGQKAEYYMFESELQRDMFVRNYVKDQNKDDKRPLEDILNDPSNEYNQGNSYQALYNSLGQASTTLTTLIKTIKASPTGDKDVLVDSVYQMYLNMLPERSFRKQFIHRKNVAGFSADALRNFARSSFRMSSQISRLAHSTPILNRMDELRGLTKGNVSGKPEMDNYIDEIADRVKYALHPEEHNGVSEKIADVANQFSFLWYLTSPASALTNLSALPVFALPVLATRYKAGFAKTAAAMSANAATIFSVKGIKSTKDGKSQYHAPSMRDVLKNEDEKRAFDEALAKGALSQTQTMDMAGLAKTPSDVYTGRGQQVMKAVGFLFHNSEQIMREIAFMTAYQLGRREGMNHDQSVKKAMDSMYESLGDFSSVSRSRFLRSPTARIMFQFKSFSQMATFYLTHNFMEMFKGESKAVKVEAGKRFFGTVGMTGMFAGLTGMPLYSAMMGVAEFVYNAMKDDDEPDRDMKLWFRNWLAETFGSKLLASAVARGPITTFTDVDFNSRIKLDDLWFRSVRQSADEAEWMRNFLTDQLGPTAGLLLSTGEAAKLINQGHLERGVEKLLPAFLKNLFVADRYSREGVKTIKGVPVFAEDEISKGDVVWQALGFAPSRVADLTQANIAIKGMEAKVKAKRAQLLQDVADDIKQGDGEELNKTLDEIAKFNSQYPYFALKTETIRQSLKNRMKNEAMAQRGLQLAKPLRPMFGPMGEYARPD